MEAVELFTVAVAAVGIWPTSVSQLYQVRGIPSPSVQLERKALLSLQIQLLVRGPKVGRPVLAIWCLQRAAMAVPAQHEKKAVTAETAVQAAVVAVEHT